MPLGADARRVVFELFRRPLGHVAVGVVVACLLVGGLVLASGSVTANALGLLLAYAALMMGVCMLGCVVPTRRALRVQPSEALRADV